MAAAVLLSAGATPSIGPAQFGDLAAALGLAAVIGLEREFRQKNAGLRTHTLVGTGAALFMLVSKYGFGDVLSPGRVMLDPSRVAAQIVTGIGFLGAGLIFVRRDAVRGLTTAAGIWMTAAIGAAAGAGLLVLATLGTALYLVVALGLSAVERRLPRSATAVSSVRVRYPDGQGMLRRLLAIATERGFAVDDFTTHPARDGATGAGAGTVEVSMHVHGRGSVNDLAAALSELPGVEAVGAADANVDPGDGG